MDPNCRTLLESSLRYHLHRLGEDATDLTLSALEGLTLVRDRARRTREHMTCTEIHNPPTWSYMIARHYRQEA